MGSADEIVPCAVIRAVWTGMPASSRWQGQAEWSEPEVLLLISNWKPIGAGTPTASHTELLPSKTTPGRDPDDATHHPAP